jgi:hypothetical protein
MAAADDAIILAAYPSYLDSWRMTVATNATIRKLQYLTALLVVLVQTVLLAMTVSVNCYLLTL